MSPAVRHDEFLRRLSTGDLSPDCDEARRHLKECPACRDRWRDVSDTIERLEQADSERREILDQSSDPGPRDIERALRAGVAAGVVSERAASRSPRHARRRLVLVCSAAAVLLCVAYLLVRDGTRGRTNVGPMLGQHDARIVDPDGILDASGIVIDYPLGPMRSFRIDLEGCSATGEHVSVQQQVWETRWRPDPALLARFSGKLLLRVQPLDAGGKPDGSAFEREFSLSR